jgi:hypothetical protein
MAGDERKGPGMRRLKLGRIGARGRQRVGHDLRDQVGDRIHGGTGSGIHVGTGACAGHARVHMHIASVREGETVPFRFSEAVWAGHLRHGT